MSLNKETHQVLSVIISKTILAKLKKEAERQRRSKSRLAEIIITDFLKKRK